VIRRVLVTLGLVVGVVLGIEGAASAAGDPALCSYSPVPFSTSTPSPDSNCGSVYGMYAAEDARRTGDVAALAAGVLVFAAGFSVGQRVVP
jgi:hypothetical protein